MITQAHPLIVEMSVFPTGPLSREFRFELMPGSTLSAMHDGRSILILADWVANLCLRSYSQLYCDTRGFESKVAKKNGPREGKKSLDSRKLTQTLSKSRIASNVDPDIPAQRG